MVHYRLSLVALAAVCACALAYPQAKEGSAEGATCHLIASTGSQVSGHLQLSQVDGKVVITGVIKGLEKGEHGFHLHQNGDTKDDCKAAGGHYNPDNTNHGDPNNSNDKKHAGDFGNIVADESGTANIKKETEQVNLKKDAERSALNRTIVVHAKPDDLGKGNTEDSIKTGSAGARLACCVVQAA